MNGRLLWLVTMSQILTQSQLKAARTCARLHKYRYIECRLPIQASGPARFGTLFHHALEQWWSAYQLAGDDRLGISLHALSALEESVELEDQVIADELLRGYHARWQDEPLVTELVEHEFTMPLVNPMTGRASRTYTLSGKIDAKVQDTRDNRTYLVEHKTTTSDISEGSGYWQRLRMDGQVSVYYNAFPDVAGCIYDVIRRPGQRRYKATPEAARTFTKGKPCKLCKAHMRAYSPPECPVCHGSGFEEPPRLHANQRAEDESLDDFRQRVREAISTDPDAYFKRGIVVRLQEEMREHQLDVWHQANLMREMANDGVHPRNPDACIQFNRQCDYYDVCTGVASIEDERLFKIGTKSHPELTQEAK